MRDFFNSTKFKVLFCVFALLFGLMIYTAINMGGTTIPETILKTITHPFTTAATSITSWVEDTLDKLVNADKYKKENEMLKQQISEMRVQVMEKDKVEKENNLLKEILKIEEKHEDYDWALCGIIARNAMSLDGGFTINKGTNDGISLYDPVITEIGLVGIVTKVAPSFSIVNTILSTEVSIGVKTMENSTIGIIENDIIYSSERKCLMSYIEKGSKIAVGDVVATSGTSGGSVYPEGHIIGTIIEIFPDENGLSLHAVIEPAVDVFRITDVFVITGFEGQENNFTE